MATTALPMLTADDWERMSWNAKQRWLLAANALRRQMLADLDRLTRAEAARAANRAQAGDTLTAAQTILDALGPDPDGHAHLEALADPRDRPERRTDTYRAQNAARMRKVRAAA